MPGDAISRTGCRSLIARRGLTRQPGSSLAGRTPAVRWRPASVIGSVRYPAGTLAITANGAPSGSSATANLPTPGMSLAGTTTVTAAAVASQSATSK
jgi:hypothetical protein